MFKILQHCGILSKILSPIEALYTDSSNQSVNVKFVGRRYLTRPGAPTVVSGKHDQKVHS